ncbi:MAG: RNA-binding cell elongation regulator Jag/EloR [Dehalococcoidia bacterium]
MAESNSIERTAKTVDEAIELALLELGVGRDEVEVDVVSNGRAGILGIGSEPAKVKVTPITGDNTSARLALGVVERMLKMVEVDAWPTIRSSGGGPDEPAVIDIQGEDAGLIIGHRGETLRALQFLVNLTINRMQDEPTSVIVDVEQYRERRSRQVRILAERSAERAVSSGSPVPMDPMSPADRRVVHMTLDDDKSVTTESYGEGSERHVVITPTGEASTSRPRQGSQGSQGSRDRGGDRRREQQPPSRAPSQRPPAYPDDRE